MKVRKYILWLAFESYLHSFNIEILNSDLAKNYDSPVRRKAVNETGMKKGEMEKRDKSSFHR